MFDQPPSLPMRAAMASLLGSLFGIGLILATHNAQAQTSATATAGYLADEDSTAVIRRIGDATLRSIRGAEATVGLGSPLGRGLRLGGSGDEAGSGLRWQMARLRELRSEGDIPRSRDLISVGVQVRF